MSQIAEHGVAPDEAADAPSAGVKRAVILHDGLAFLALVAITVALFGVTWFLFRSFEEHRADLAREWAAEGRTELAAHKPGQAVNSLRAALSYAPDDYGSQLLLAQALADEGELAQANDYFAGMWAARPGDGFLNLQLARLARRQGDSQGAIEKYRAAISGEWPGDGAVRRREVRMELVDYLTEQGRNTAARLEVMLAAGNAPDDPRLNKMFGDKMLAAGDALEALKFYDKVLARQPENAAVRERAVALSDLAGGGL